MSIKVSIMKQIQIRYKGIYDFHGIYALLRDWFNNHRYDFMEPKYKDKVGGPFGNEVEIDMACELKVDEYIKYHIKIETKFIDVKEFETEIDGEKKLRTDGKFFIKLIGWVEHDYTGRFSSPFEKWLHDLLVKKILKKYYEFKYYDPLIKEVYDIQTQIKKHINMEAADNAY